MNSLLQHHAICYSFICAYFLRICLFIHLFHPCTCGVWVGFWKSGRHKLTKYAQINKYAQLKNMHKFKKCINKLFSPAGVECGQESGRVGDAADGARLSPSDSRNCQLETRYIYIYILYFFCIFFCIFFFAADGARLSPPEFRNSQLGLILQKT